MVNYDRQTQGLLSKTAPKGPSYMSNRKETKYAAISFSNERSEEGVPLAGAGKAQPTGHISMEKIITQVSQEKISLAPYEDQDDNKGADTYELKNGKQAPVELFFGESNAEQEQNISIIQHAKDEDDASMVGEGNRTANERQESFGPEAETRWPMKVEEFLDSYGHVMLPEELEELKKQRASFEMIYFPGSIPSRRLEDLEILKGLNEERAATFKEKRENTDSSNNNGEYQGNPAFDNHEGYYRVQIGEHLAYRYEIMKILGKGSFAQVVQCKDHKRPGSPLYAVKITRNTEMDHKFAHKEAQYLKYIMQEDPQDKHNIVRMVD